MRHHRECQHMLSHLRKSQKEKSKRQKVSGSNALTKLPKSDDYSHPRCEFTDSGLGRWERATLKHIVKLLQPKDKETCEHQREKWLIMYKGSSRLDGWLQHKKILKPEAVIWHNWSPRRKVLSPKNSVPNKTILWSWRAYIKTFLGKHKLRDLPW